MAAFDYKALDKRGKQVKGVLEADTVRQVRQQLREKGLVPVEVEQTKSQKADKEKGKSLFSSSGPRINTAELALLTRQLATLVQSAMPIESALAAVAEQTEKPAHKSMVMGVRAKVIEGYSLAEGLGEYSSVFDKLFCAMVAAGEKSGHLDAVLERLADYTENRQKIRSQITKAITYPAVLTLVSTGIVIFLLTDVLPSIIKQFKSSGAELPQLTQLMLNISEFITSYGAFVLVGIITAIFAFKRALKQPKFKKSYDKKLLELPTLGKIIKGQNTSSYARTLAILTSSSVPLLEGMRIAGRVIENTHMQESLSEAATKVREGAALKTSLEQTKLFPPMMLHMIASGEKSGELEQMLTRAADNQDNMFENQVDIALKIFEPVLILGMAGMVLCIVMAILQPIMQLSSLVG